MPPPDQDETDRRPIWDALGVLWLDTDANLFLPESAQRCARSKYSLDELEEIFWNEVRPALWFNMFDIVGEWAGWDINWLAGRILKKHLYGKSIPVKILHPHSNHWWKKLAREIERVRSGS